MKPWNSIAALLAVLPTFAQAQPIFERRSIIDHIYSGGWEHFVGGGVAVFDCNGDHRPELFAAGGAGPARLFLNQSGAGDFSFQADTPEALDLTGVIGAYPINIDGDGLTDLVVLRVGENRVLRGTGDCGFRPWPELALDSGDRWTTAFSATWEGANALPTMAFGNYVNRDDPNGPFEACDKNYLFRPKGSTYGAPTPLTPGFCPLSILFSDWGRQGRADLRMSNDRHYYVRGGQEQMWAMEAEPRLYLESEGWNTHMLWGMGIASRDLTGDGLPEVFLSSMGDQKLQVLTGAHGPNFDTVPFSRGTSAHRPYIGDDGRPSTGWHIAFGDVQNDGLDDVFIAKGNVEQMPDAAMEDPNNLLIQSPDGSFLEQGSESGVADLSRGRGAALADLDQDGRLDLVVVNRRSPLLLYRNVTPDVGNWLAISLSQPAPNTDAIGAWIEVEAAGRVQAREVTVGGGHAGGSLIPEHFGLGSAERARVRVIWPDGSTAEWVEVAAGQALRLRRGVGPERIY